jgi:hypothetical protein
MASNYSFRIETGAFTQLSAVMRDGTASAEQLQSAFNQLVNSSPQLASSINRAEEATKRLVDQHRELETATNNAHGGFSKMGQVVQQAGFQLGDFVVQVQNGTSALVALSQQGSQFLGLFGATGAIAGVVLSIGSVAAQFLTAGNNAEAMKKSAEDAFKGISAAAESTAQIIDKVNQLFRTSSQNAAAARQAQVESLKAQVAQNQSTTIGRMDEAASDVARADSEIAKTQAQLNTPGLPNLARRRLERDLQAWQDVRAGSQAFLDRQSDQMGRLNEQAQRLNNVPAEQPQDPPRERAPSVGRARSGGGGGGGGRMRAAPVDDGARQDDAIERAGLAAAGSINPSLAIKQRYDDLYDKLNAAADLFERTGGQRGISPDDRTTLQEMARTRAVEDLKKLEQGMQSVQRSASETGRAFQGMGLNLTGAFDSILERANRTWGGVFAGTNRASQGVHMLETQLVKLISDNFITKPLNSAVNDLASKAFGGSSGSGGTGTGGMLGGLLSGAGSWLGKQLGGSFGNLFGGGSGSNAGVEIYSSPIGPGIPFARGGIMTQWGAVPLRAYAGGGVANQPQAAIFGEGSTPEAFVPLPDGRSIPVAMKGGGSSPTFFIDARGADAGVEARINSVLARNIPGIVNITKASLGADVSRGGTAAQAFGRRPPGA